MIFIDHLYDADQNIHWYHTGYAPLPKYREFYAWLRPVALHYDYSDMPHHNFVLLHEADRLRMHAEFADSLAPMQPGTFHRADYVDLTAKVDPESPEAIVAAMLSAAIQEEIDAEVITRAFTVPPLRET